MVFWMIFGWVYDFFLEVVYLGFRDEKRMKNRIKLLIIRFKNELRTSEIKFFRGAVLSRVCGTPHDVLFSGHTEDGLRYSYPLIQYKRIGGKAALVCIGEGVESIGEFFSSCDFDLQIGNREPERFEIDSVDAKQIVVQAWDDTFRYTLRKWLPLNSDNYREFQQLEGLAARAEFLQRILVGNILSMCKGLDIYLEREVTCEILRLEEPRTLKYKGVMMQSFDVEFKTNVSLPDLARRRSQFPAVVMRLI
ncbi:MAG: CRISPR-associated endonuclease Cas6 [Paludibacteraceae bacterium]|nr:CRISPR-associated endonuclease Cas6 [Paludibacteraceae bacterium]